MIQVTDEDVAGRRRFDTPWRRTCFRIGDEWPVKVVLYAPGGRARRIDVVVDHVAIDPWGMRVLCDDLNNAIRSRVAGREPFGAVAAEQPIDVALSETSPAGLVYQRRALSYWEQRLRGFRKALDGHTRAVPPARSRPSSEQGSFRSCWLISRRAGQAAGTIARASRVSPPPPSSSPSAPRSARWSGRRGLACSPSPRTGSPPGRTARCGRRP
ncbi:hypothetical protein ACFQX6_31540 [Streptosporangium lutulentum]